MAVEFETRMCSTRNAPTGTMPLMECRRRSRKECPWPARSGGTPGRTVCASGCGLTREAICAVLSLRFGRARRNLSLWKLASRCVKKPLRQEEGQGLTFCGHCTCAAEVAGYNGRDTSQVQETHRWLPR